MRAMVLHSPPAAAGTRAQLLPAEVPLPIPGPRELLVSVAVCSVCRTDLDLVEGRLRPAHYPIIPGHQIVGVVAGAGAGVSGYEEGERVGVAWINSACGHCRWCVSGEENLCPDFRATGCDFDGGYAAYATVPAAFAHRIPRSLGDAEAAPLLCAGAIGLRALRLTHLRDGDPLGLTGFGASAHLVLQLAKRQFPDSPVYVFARNESERDFALQLGADWAGDIGDSPPSLLGAVIDTTPAWRPVVAALASLMPGGRVVVNAIRKSPADRAELLKLGYETHLWMERELKTVANVTRADVRDVLAIAAAAPGIRPAVVEFSLDQANQALEQLGAGSGVRGAMLLRI